MFYETEFNLAFRILSSLPLEGKGDDKRED
jgi:hypothetical protein